MKKNLISVIILALTVANLVLTALLVFTILPETKKANQLIDSVCQAIDLDLNSGAAGSSTSIPIDQIETYTVNDGESMTINLRTDAKADGSAGTSYYAILVVSLSLNVESDNYEKYSPTVLAEKETIIQDDIRQIVSQYSKDELDADPQTVKDEILADMQSMFGADYVVGVNFPQMQTGK
jgi:flagellar FliL protein